MSKVAAFFPCYILCLCVNRLRTHDYTSVKVTTWKSVDLGWGSIFNKKDQPSERNTKLVIIYFIPLHVTLLWECVWLSLGTGIMNQSVSKAHPWRPVSNVGIWELTDYLHELDILIQGLSGINHQFFWKGIKMFCCRDQLKLQSCKLRVVRHTCV